MLLYQCAHCKKMVSWGESPHWIDDGTVFFCPSCGQETQFRLIPLPLDAATAGADGEQERPAAQVKLGR
jgi:DNA-directed RNA polymerase subunit RPC12/RpoP